MLYPEASISGATRCYGRIRMPARESVGNLKGNALLADEVCFSTSERKRLIKHDPTKSLQMNAKRAVIGVCCRLQHARYPSQYFLQIGPGIPLDFAHAARAELGGDGRRQWTCRLFVQARQNSHPGLPRQHPKDSGCRDRRHRPFGIFFSLSLEHGCFFIRIVDQ
jgi:hypothetical protein